MDQIFDDPEIKNLADKLKKVEINQEKNLKEDIEEDRKIPDPTKALPYERCLKFINSI